jgi:hypothetical protein
MSSVEALLKEDSMRNVRSLLKVVILITIAGAAVASRLFSVIRKLLSLGGFMANRVLIGIVGFESIIHECMWSFWRKV